MKDKPTFAASDVIIEYRVQGRYVKVSAIDPITCEEVSIFGDVKHAKEYLASQAVKKTAPTAGETLNRMLCERFSIILFL